MIERVAEPDETWLERGQVGLKIFDPDEEQSEASKYGSDRARFALGDQPEKGADPEHR